MITLIIILKKKIFFPHSGSSKSIHSNSGSSNSSGYGGLPATVEEFPQPRTTKTKLKDHKKKKCKTQEPITSNENTKTEEIKEVVSENIETTARSGVANSPATLNNINNNATTNNTNAGSNNNMTNSNTSSANNNSINNCTNANSCEALQLAAVAHTLNCIKKIKSTGE